MRLISVILFCSCLVLGHVAMAAVPPVHLNDMNIAVSK